MLPKIGREPLSEQAYKVIKEAILNHQIKAKDILLEDALAETLGISKTPLRAALKRLEYEKLVVINSSKHAIVAEIKPEDMLKIFELRMAVEPVIARYACRKMTPKIMREIEELRHRHIAAMKANDFVKVTACELEFDALLVKAADNEFFADIRKMISSYMQRFLILAATTEHDTPLSIAEHDKIIEAIKTKDCEAAEKWMRHHLKLVASRLNMDFDT